MTQSLIGKVAVVTGGNTGIGRAAAIRFAAEGCKVVVAASSDDSREQTVETIRERGGEAIFVQADVAHANSVEGMVARAVEVFGRIDYAFNNAGVSGGGLLHEFEESAWDRVLGINLKGTWLCMKYQIAQMLKQGGGSIVNNSSIAGLTGSALSPAYSASKHGVIGLTKSASLQYIKKGIRINAICPGVIKTPMIEGLYERAPHMKTWLESKLPTGQAGSPKAVAQTVVWLCSDAASYITGAALPVDEGMTAGFW